MKTHQVIYYLSPKTKLLIALIVSVVIFDFANIIVYANAPAPPSAVWFIFDYQTSQRLELKGIQLIGCETEVCKQPVLLQQYGICDALDCLRSQPTLVEWPSSLECAENRCRSAASQYMYNNLYFKIIAQFSDETRTSKVIGRLPGGDSGEEEFWRVIVNDTGLIVVKDSNFANKPLRINQFFIGFVLTQLTEVIVAIFYCRFRLKMNSKDTLGVLLMIFLINLATFPVVWLFFPNLEHFALNSSRSHGVGILAVAGCYAVMLVSVYKSKDKTQRIKRIALAVVIIPLAIFCFLIYAFITAYGNYAISASGVSFIATIIMAEIFAVVAEAILLFLCSRNRLALRYSSELSLVMNATSLLLGVLILKGW